jgi:hypothetical protein
MMPQDCPRPPVLEAVDPESQAAISMLTRHQQPNPRVARPGRESNPVHSLSQKEADVQSQGAV